MAPRHERLWEWFADLRPGTKPRPRTEVWPRGGGKSTTTELAITYTLEQRRRRFALYVCAVQAQANKHVGAISSAFERLGLERATNRYGASVGWKVDMLRVAGNLNVLALGLDSAARGLKLDDFRPDLIILDDVDERHDSEKAVHKKIVSLTQDVLPMGARDSAVLVIQNRVHVGSVTSQLADGQADFLMNREVFEEPAVEGLEIEAEAQKDGTRKYRITAGHATWAGQDLATCEQQLNEWGRPAFKREAQHDMTEVEGGLWDRARDIDAFRIAPAQREALLKQLTRIVVAVDPNAEGGADEAGIVAGGVLYLNRQRHAVLLEDRSTGEGPLGWAREAVNCYRGNGATTLVAEKNNGGKMVEVTIGTVPGAPRVKLVHASKGKLTRAEPIQKLAEEGRIHHIGTFPELESELCRWVPGEPSPNRLDAYVWLMTELMIGPGAEPLILGGPTLAHTSLWTGVGAGDALPPHLGGT